MSSGTQRYDDLVILLGHADGIVNEATQCLRAQNYGVATLSSWSVTQEFIRANSKSFMIVIMELHLPDASVLDVCNILGAGQLGRRIPVVIWTNGARDEERIAGFEAGAEDFILKTWSVREFYLRVSRVANNWKSKDTRLDEIRFGDLVLDLQRRRVQINGRDLKITGTEFRLFAELAENSGSVCSREMLLRKIWPGEPNAGSRSLDAHICRLKFKLADFGRNIETIHGKGYALRNLEREASLGRVHSPTHSGNT